MIVHEDTKLRAWGVHTVVGLVIRPRLSASRKVHGIAVCEGRTISPSGRNDLFVALSVALQLHPNPEGMSKIFLDQI
jgi:hypothetical protein